MNTTLKVLCQLCRDAGLPEPVAEYEFAHTKHRADYAWPDYHVALERDGGRWIKNGGRHNRGSHTDEEHRKRNLYATYGWRVLYRTPQNLLTDETVELVRRALFA